MMLLMPVLYFIVVVLSLSSALSYQCAFNETCTIDCSGIVNNASTIPTQCTDLTIDASIASSLTVSCANNSYCDSMTIYAPSYCVVNCVGDGHGNRDDQVCNNIQIYTNNTVSQITCDSNNGNACSNANIYGHTSQGTGTPEGKTDLYCASNTLCDSISIHHSDHDTTSITISNAGIMNNLNVTAPYAHTLTFDPTSGTYNNSYVDNRYASIQTRIGTAAWINSQFYLGGLTYNNWAGLDFYNNKIHCFFGIHEVILLFSGDATIHDNTFFVENNPIDIRVEEKVRFVRNDIFINNTHNFHVYMAGVNAYIANNSIYAQNAKKIDFEIDDPRDSIYNNNFYFDHAENVTLNIYGKFFANKLYGDNIQRFTLLCLLSEAICGSGTDEDKYMLSNAKYVLLQAGGGKDAAGGIMDGGYFDVSNVSRVEIFSYFGFIRNVNINARSAAHVNVTMYSGSLYNSVINASMSSRLIVWCKSFNYYDEMNDTDCSELILRVPPPPADASLTCDGMGCQSLILYTTSGAGEVNITGENCNCHSLDSYAHAQCIDEWQIYCDANQNNASVLSSIAQCDGVCCDDVVENLDFQDLGHCKKDKKSGLSGLWIAFIVVAVLLFLAIVGCWVWNCYRKKNAKRKEPLLLQEDAE